MEDQRNDGNVEIRQEEPNMQVRYTFSEEQENSPKEQSLFEKEQEKKEKKYYFTGMLTGIFLSIVLVCGGLLVWSIVRDKKENAVVETSVVNDTSTAKLQILQDTIEQYYLEEVDEAALEEGMYAGLLEALDDPYSVYYTAEELQDIYEKTKGVYYGIGAYVGIDTTTGYPYISKIIDDTPASASELRAGDLIYEVEGESVYGMDTSEVVAKIKGDEGTDVHMTIARMSGSSYEYIDITITRAKINNPTVSYKMLDNGIAYIEIVEFDDITTDQFTDALATAKGSGMRGLILDLRGNPGGNLSTVVAIAQQMLPEGLIVYTEDKYGYREEYTCDGKRQLDVPLVVLVDGNSASASEILAGAIKDYGIGTLVGTTTFGKGIVQRIMQLTDGSAIKLTISKYYTPNGYNIHGTGIEPDVVVEFDMDSYLEDGTDNQLEEAERIMQELLDE